MSNLENEAKAETLYQKLSSYNWISQDTAKDYEQILELNPNHVLALWNVGRIYDGEYDHAGYGSECDAFYGANKERAIYCFTRIVELDPKFSQVYNRLGKIYLGSKDEKALQFFTQYLNFNHEDYTAICKVGEINYRLNNKEEAMANFTKCIQHDQKDSSALHGLAKIYQSEGNFKDTLQCLKRCIEIYDKDSSTYAQIGQVYDKMGNIKEAINFYRRCNQLNSENKQAQHYLKKHSTKDFKH